MAELPLAEPVVGSPNSRVLIHKEDNRLIIEPELRPNLLDTLRLLSPLDPEDAFPDDLDGPLLPVRDVNL